MWIVMITLLLCLKFIQDDLAYLYFQAYVCVYMRETAIVPIPLYMLQYLHKLYIQVTSSCFDYSLLSGIIVKDRFFRVWLEKLLLPYLTLS